MLRNNGEAGRQENESGCNGVLGVRCTAEKRVAAPKPGDTIDGTVAAFMVMAQSLTSSSDCPHLGHFSGFSLRIEKLG
jgi:hypothetical protein